MQAKSKIVKVCKKHGRLTFDDCYGPYLVKYKNSFEYRCKKCNKKNTAKYFSVNPFARQDHQKKCIQYNQRSKKALKRGNNKKMQEYKQKYGKISSPTTN